MSDLPPEATGIGDAGLLEKEFEKHWGKVVDSNSPKQEWWSGYCFNWGTHVDHATKCDGRCSRRSSQEGNSNV